MSHINRFSIAFQFRSKALRDDCQHMAVRSNSIKRKFSGIIGLALMMNLGVVNAAEYSLAVPPILPRAEMQKNYQVLADYISDETGDTVKLTAFSSFKSYFANMKRKKGFDIVFDAAHFTNYRTENMGYRVLAKLPDTVSFTLVTGPDLMVFDAEELIPYKIATMTSPSVGGLRLREMYPDSSKSPTIVRAVDAVDAVNQIQDGRADAAMIPTPLVGQYGDLNVVLTTSPLPHMGISVSADIPQAVADKIKRAMVNADETENGKAMLEALKFPGFVSASNEDYEGFGKLLKFTKRNKPMQTAK